MQHQQLVLLRDGHGPIQTLIKVRDNRSGLPKADIVLTRWASRSNSNYADKLTDLTVPIWFKSNHHSMAFEVQQAWGTFLDFVRTVEQVRLELSQSLAVLRFWLLPLPDYVRR